MTWTYDPTLATDRDKIRTLIGDTNTADQLLTDEQIAYMLAQTPQVDLAAAECCDLILAKLARDIDRSNIGMSSQRSQKVQHYQDLAQRLRAKAGTLSQTYVGGLSLAEKDELNDDADYVPMPFAVGRDENRR